MLTQAADEHHITLASSFVIGDRCVDMLAGEQAGCGTVLVLTGYGTIEKDECLTAARVDHVSPDAYDAWQYVRQQLQQHERRKGFSA